MQNSSRPTKFTTPFAQNALPANFTELPTTTADPTRASQSLGFPPLTMTPVSAGGVPPQGPDANGAINQVARTAWWLMAGGLYAYDNAWSTQSVINGYPAAATLVGQNNVAGIASNYVIMSRVDNNVYDPTGTGSGAYGGYWGPPGNAGYEIPNASGSITLSDVQAASSYVRFTGTIPISGATLSLPTTRGNYAPYRLTVINDASPGSVSVSPSAGGPTFTVSPGQRAQLLQRNDGTFFDPASTTPNSTNNLVFNSSANFGPLNWQLPAGFTAQTTNNGYGPTVACAALTTQNFTLRTPGAAFGAGGVCTGTVDIYTLGVSAGTLNWTMEAFDSVGTNLGSVGVGTGVLTAVGGMNRYTITGTTTPPNTASVTLTLTGAGVTASAGGIIVRRAKIQAGAISTPYSQEQDNVSTINAPAMAVGAAGAAHGTIGMQGYEIKTNGQIRQWVTMQLQDNAAGAALDTWTYPLAFKNAVTAIRGTNLARAAGQLGVVVNSERATLSPGLPSLTSVALGIDNIGTTGSNAWMLIEVEGY